MRFLVFSVSMLLMSIAPVSASRDCVDLTGTYTLLSPCEESTYSGEGMLFPLKRVMGGISVGSSLLITHTSCQSVTLGTERRMSNGTLYTSQNTFDEGLRYRNDGQLYFKFNDSELPFSVFKGSVKIEKTHDGIVFDMESSSWNIVFQQSVLKISNKCSLIKI